MCEQTLGHRVIRVVLGIVVFALIVGLWACLWVSPYVNLN